MPPAVAKYNERAWAIDVIGEIRDWARTRAGTIRHASGERTVSGKTALFPDVLLHGDTDGASVLMGWEMKMPDTPITDADLLENAAEKARRLHLNSFLVWNAADAALHVLDNEGGWPAVKTWKVPGITKREHVEAGGPAWKKATQDILDDLERFLSDGTVKGAALGDVLGETGLALFLAQREAALGEHLKALGLKDTALKADVENWWKDVKVEYGDGVTPWKARARTIIVAWFTRIVFAHLLSAKVKDARDVGGIGPDTTVADAIAIFRRIAASCGFPEVLAPHDHEELLDDETWSVLVELNGLLKGAEAKALPEGVASGVLEGVVAASRRRKALGQYATPRLLADLLVRLAVRDLTGNVLDPCCGSGTIARAAIDAKIAAGIEAEDALPTVWMGDKHTLPLQLATLAAAVPSLGGVPVRAFQANARDLRKGGIVRVGRPDGDGEDEELPAFHAVVTNPPYVRFETRIGEEGGNGRMDLYGHLLPALARVMARGGRMAAVVANSWMGTNWGAEFLRRLDEAGLDVEAMVVSGAGRWFDNAKVVATILVLRRRAKGEEAGARPISFVTTREPISAWDQDSVGEMANLVIGKPKASPRLRRLVREADDVAAARGVDLGWMALFADTSWLPDVQNHLVPLSPSFTVFRGDRWGWNALFHPEDGHGIEGRYLRPLVKSSKSVKGYVGEADAQAFVCRRTEEELKAKGRTGALRWVRKFAKAVNEEGTPLPDLFKRRDGLPWYYREGESRADFLTVLNPGRRLFVFSLDETPQVDQRFIALQHDGGEEDRDLWHAVLNCSLSLYWMEATGFGRGEGVLDLNVTAFRERMRVLDATAIGEEEREAVLEAFADMKGRHVLDLPEELKAEDRIALDTALEAAFGIPEGTMAKVRASLLDLFLIRDSVTKSAVPQPAVPPAKAAKPKKAA